MRRRILRGSSSVDRLGRAACGVPRVRWPEKVSARFWNPLIPLQRRRLGVLKAHSAFFSGCKTLASRWSVGVARHRSCWVREYVVLVWKGLGMKILVTGAAGFIGSVVTELLVGEGHQVVGFDSLVHGNRGAVHPDAELIVGDLLDAEHLKRLLQHGRFDAVAHLAAEALIDESIRDPGRFYRANVVGGIHLLDAMVEAGVKRIVFSSTAAVYGQPEATPIPEDAPKNPCNSYGDSKLAFEHILAWYRVAHDLRYVCLRYFNACGATARCGEFRDRETHLIPICFEAALGERPALQLFGTDYDTPDGTCVRDYVHAADIARAHLLALERIDALEARAFNLGNGDGYSNLQVVEAVRTVTGLPVDVVPTGRRAGDPARLVASSDRARAELGWRPEFPELERMVDTAWKWRRSHRRGYEA